MKVRAETTDDRIAAAGWFKGSERDWQALSHEERERIAFKGCGCAVAYPTWKGPVDCVHTTCQVLRGEIRPIVETNRVLRAEMERGYLRFGLESREGRIHIARLIRHIRRAAIETGIYDPWKIPGAWKGIVAAAVCEITR